MLYTAFRLNCHHEGCGRGSRNEEAELKFVSDFKSTFYDLISARANESLIYLFLANTCVCLCVTEIGIHIYIYIVDDAYLE